MTNPIEYLDKRFQSGNDISIDKATVPREEWEAVKAEVERLRSMIAPAATQLRSPSGEELYYMVMGRRQPFPYALCTPLGKETWEEAASSVLLRPDTILAQHGAGNRSS